MPPLLPGRPHLACPLPPGAAVLGLPMRLLHLVAEATVSAHLLSPWEAGALGLGLGRQLEQQLLLP